MEKEPRRGAPGEFPDRLVRAVEERRSYLAVGLDPNLATMPAELADTAVDLRSAAAAAARFCRSIIDGVADVVPVVKPQSAFFEAFGAAGAYALEEVIGYAKERGLLVIEDAKRGDIGSTMAAYATAHLGRLRLGTRDVPVHDVDAVTVNAYLGPDTLEPMLEACDRWGKGIFVLVRTSNPRSGHIQRLATERGPVFERIARLVTEVGRERRGTYGFASVGAVTGLTHPEDAAALRSLMPYATLLVPGLGAQGGRSQDLPLFFDDRGLGAIAVAARAIADGWRAQASGSMDERVREGARAAARSLNLAIDEALAQADKRRW